MKLTRITSLVIVLSACSSQSPTSPDKDKDKDTKAAMPTSGKGDAPMAGDAPAPMAAKEMAPASAPPQVVLGETPDAKLGTAPDGFGLKVGDKAPDASLLDIAGKTQSLAALFAAKPTVLVFYRGGWCPFCNVQLHELSEAKADFDGRGVQLVAISVDKPSEEAKTQAQQGVPFAMLSDPKLVAHEAFHVVHVPGDVERKKIAEYKLDLAAYSGEDHGKFAVPSIFLVGRDGVIRFVHIDEDYKVRPSVKQLLAVVDKTFGSK